MPKQSNRSFETYAEATGLVTCLGACGLELFTEQPSGKVFIVGTVLFVSSAIAETIRAKRNNETNPRWVGKP